MLKNFVGVWLLYWLTVAILPVSSLYPATLEALLLQAAFVALVALSFATVDFLTGAAQVPRAGRVDTEIAGAPTIVRAAIVLSLIGLAAQAYDKIVIQGIDYSEGVAVARETWRRLGEERDGAPSSVYSMLAYLFGSAYFVAVVIVITHIKVLTSGQRGRVLAACFLLMMGNALLSGGRSNVLLLAAFVVSAFSLRRGLELRRLMGSPTQRTFAKGLVVLAGAYLIYVFFERAEAGEVSAIEYAFEFLPFLGLEANPWFRAMLDGGAMSSLSAMVVLALSYVTHSFATAAAIVEGPTEDKSILFLHAAGILYKLGLGSAPDGDWFLTGRFPSLPGALWHQYGALGFGAASLALGAIAASARVWAIRSPRRLVPMGVCLLVDAILLLSPALFAADFLSFPFVVASFLVLAAWARLRG